MKIDIANVDKAEIVQALYHAAQGEDMGVSLHHIQERMDKGQTYFSTLGKKVLRIDVGGDELDPTEYNRVNGAMHGEALRDGLKVGRAQKALEDAGLVGPQPGSETGSRTTISQPAPTLPHHPSTEKVAAESSSSSNGSTTDLAESPPSSPEDEESLDQEAEPVS